MDIGMALTAARAYGEADDARILREQQRQRFGWDKQFTEAELGLLPDKIEAQRSGLGLQTAANRANIELMPGQTENARTQQRITALDQASALATAPDRAAAAAAQAKGAALSSQDALLRLPREMAANNALSDFQKGQVLYGALGRTLRAEDKPGTLALMNNIAKEDGVFPQVHKGMNFVDVAAEPRTNPRTFQNEPGYSFQADNGQKVWIPASAIADGLQSMQNGKWKAGHTNDGTVYGLNENTGAFKTFVQGNPKVNALGDRRPREIQLHEFYKSFKNPDGSPMYNDMQAAEKVKELGHKPRQQFEADTMKDAMAMATGDTAQERAANAYAMVKAAADLVYGAGSGPGATAPTPGTAPPAKPGSNTLTPGTVPQNILDAIGYVPPK